MARLRSECIACLIKNHLWDVPACAPEDIKREYMQKLMKIIADAEKDDSAPVLLDRISKVKNSLYPGPDKYAEIKFHFNEVMLSYEKSTEEHISASAEPLKTALKYSMVGNFIDFGAMENVDEAELTRLLNSAEDVTFSEDEYIRLKQELCSCKKLVLLADNCGEIVMDKLLLKLIKKNYPDIEVSVIVRGAPVINDATVEDAVQTGISDSFDVIGNGSGVAGTDLKQISTEALDAINNADIILSKGQGNFETLQHCGLNVYYVFLCKCDMFADIFSVEKFSGILIGDKRLDDYFKG